MDETPEAYRARILSYATDDVHRVLETTAGRLRALVAGRPTAALDWTDASGGWSTRQILAHLADTEVAAAWQFRATLAQEAVPVQPFDPNAWAETFRYADADPAGCIELFDVTRRSLLALLRRADPRALTHVAAHPTYGAQSIDELVRMRAGHDVNHLRQIERLLASAPDRGAFVPAPMKAVAAEALEALDVRVGTIVSIDDVPGSRKLVQLSVTFGDCTRRVLAGLKQERPDVRVLVGRQALFVVNLPSRTMAGLTSDAMLFDLGYADDLLPCLAVPERPMPDGTRAG